MDITAYCNAIGLDSKIELEKVCYLAYFFLKSGKQPDFTISEAGDWLESMHLGYPNVARLRKNLKGSRYTVAGARPDSFKLHQRFLSKPELAELTLGTKREDPIDTGSILPMGLCDQAIGPVKSLAAQVNASYEHSIFDGCAVLMRRLMEILLILSYEKLGVDSEISDSASAYMMLEKIIDNAVGNTKLKLSRNSKKTLEVFRTLGNFSAHKIYYNCKYQDLSKVVLEYRALIEELLYKSGNRN